MRLRIKLMQPLIYRIVMRSSLCKKIAKIRVVLLVFYYYGILLLPYTQKKKKKAPIFKVMLH